MIPPIKSQIVFLDELELNLDLLLTVVFSELEVGQ